jgi:hypothetical protein
VDSDPDETRLIPTEFNFPQQGSGRSHLKIAFKLSISIPSRLASLVHLLLSLKIRL